MHMEAGSDEHGAQEQRRNKRVLRETAAFWAELKHGRVNMSSHE